MRSAVLVLAFCLVCVLALLVVRTLLVVSAQTERVAATDTAVVTHAAADRLAQAIRFRTVSFEQHDQFDSAAFRGLHDYLAQVFPRTHESLAKETVGEYSLLFTWPGRDHRLKPVLFIGHLDVVPVEKETEDLWGFPPFAGKIAAGYVWGRGAIDDKGRVMAMLEAVERLVGQGFTPERTIMLAFGHDEEVGTNEGAARIAARLAERQLEIESIFDEGGAIVSRGMLPGVSEPIALVGIGEKGFLSLELSVQGETGHSSTPPRHTAVGILSSAIHQLEEHQLPTRINGPTQKLLEALATRMPFEKRLVLANLWLFGPLVEWELGAAPLTNAMIRTTMATTMIEGGVKSTVLPARARAIVNFRLLPGDSIEDTIVHANRIIADRRVTVTPLPNPHGPPSVSSTDSWGFRVLARTIRQIYGDVLVAPFLVPFRTDSRHYANLSRNIYRLNPVLVEPDDLKRIHGTNERIAIQAHGKSIQFYKQLFQNME